MISIEGLCMQCRQCLSFGTARLAIVLSVTVFFQGCAGTPPPMPADAGQIEGPQTAVGWVPGMYAGGPVYGKCNRILSIDGGGVRGIIPAIMLEEIERRTHKSISELFDLIAGTSTGAVIALGLTRRDDNDVQKPAFRAADMVKFYTEKGSEVFPDSLGALRNLRRYFAPKYRAQGIESILDMYFGDVQLIESLTRVLIPAYEIEDGRRMWFDSHDRNAQNLYVKDIARGATAAPTYLPPARFAVPNTMSEKGYVALVDGGVFANNPSITALSHGVRTWTGSKDFLLVSLGTGGQKTRHRFEEVWGWGTLAWIDPLLEIVFSDPAIDADLSTIASINGDQYIRLQVELDEAALTLDDASPDSLAKLRDATQKFLERNNRQLDLVVAWLTFPRPPTCGYKIGVPYAPPSGPRKHKGDKEPD